MFFVLLEGRLSSTWGDLRSKLQPFLGSLQMLNTGALRPSEGGALSTCSGDSFRNGYRSCDRQKMEELVGKYMPTAPTRKLAPDAQRQITQRLCNEDVAKIAEKQKYVPLCRCKACVCPKQSSF